jgi:hypothetical protein
VLGTGQAAALESEMHRALGRCLGRKHDWKGAISAYQRALGPLIAQGRRPALLELYAELASAYASSGQLDRALRELTEGLDMCTLGDGPRRRQRFSLFLPGQRNRCCGGVESRAGGEPAVGFLANPGRQGSRSQRADERALRRPIRTLPN